jgi:hypothetical protein
MENANVKNNIYVNNPTNSRLVVAEVNSIDIA